MFPAGGVCMKMNRLLISSSMIAAMCEKSATDNLKLLEPFVIVCLSDLFVPGEQIKKEKVISLLEQRFAFQEMPTAVLDKILSRISQKGDKIVLSLKISGEDGRQFIFVEKPENLLTQFKVQETQATHDTDEVLHKISDWVKKEAPSLKVTEDELRCCLGTFFEDHGFDVLYEVDELRNSTIGNTDAIHYQIGRFILDCQENDSSIFDKIAHLAEGMMIASAIYIDTALPSRHVAKRRLSEVNVYLDTTFLLYALNYKTPFQKASADALLNLLRSNGAHLYVFQQHFYEIEDILKSFRDRDGYSTKNYQHLERLEEEEYTSIEIDLEIKKLESSLKTLDILVAPKTSYTDGNGKLFSEKTSYIDYNGLKSHLANKILQYGKRPTMLINDTEAISSVIIERCGLRYDNIESCPAIFVTTNYALVRESNQFLRYPVYSMLINPIMSDIDITTILWLKYGMKSTNIPSLKLIEYARSAMAPSASVMETFYGITKRLAASGELTEDEAADLRYSAYARAEITAYCGGNAAVLDDTSVLVVRDRLKRKYTADVTAQLQEALAKTTATEDMAKQANKRATSSESKLSDATKTIRANIRKIYRSAEDDAKKFASKCACIIKRIIIAAIAILTAVTTGAVAKITFSTEDINLVYIISALTTVASIIIMWIPAFSLSSKIYNTVYRKCFDKRYAKNISQNQSKIDEWKTLLDAISFNKV